MKTKEEIVANWLPRYTKRKLEDFGEYILLTNFNKYVEIFAERFNVPILGRDANMTSAHAEGITIINFGMGSPNAAIIMDLLSAIHPKACLFLGKCGGIDRKNQIGDLEKERPMITIRLRFLPCRLLCCREPCRHPSVTTPATTGQEPSIQPTGASGNTTRSSRNTC